jgi:hypothetical protein
VDPLAEAGRSRQLQRTAVATKRGYIDVKRQRLSRIAVWNGTLADKRARNKENGKGLRDSPLLKARFCNREKVLPALPVTSLSHQNEELLAS